MEGQEKRLTALETRNEAQKIADLTTRLETLESAKKSAEAKGGTEESKNLDTKINDFRDEERRRNNIIIFNAEESKEEDGGRRSQDDRKYVLDMCQGPLNLSAEVTDHSIARVTRLGPRDEYEEERGTQTRPLLVVFRSLDTKLQVLRNSRLLADSDIHQLIVIKHDLTKTQRKELKELNVEAKKRESAEQGNYLYRVRGPPGEWRIKKIKKA